MCFNRPILKQSRKSISANHDFITLLNITKVRKQQSIIKISGIFYYNKYIPIYVYISVLSVLSVCI